MKAKIIPIRTVPRPSIREKLLKAELEHTMKRARDALYRYGFHLEDCPAMPPMKDRTPMGDDDAEECTCGLYDTINSFHKVG